MYILYLCLLVFPCQPLPVSRCNRLSFGIIPICMYLLTVSKHVQLFHCYEFNRTVQCKNILFLLHKRRRLVIPSDCQKSHKHYCLWPQVIFDSLSLSTHGSQSWLTEVKYFGFRSSSVWLKGETSCLSVCQTGLFEATTTPSIKTLAWMVLILKLLCGVTPSGQVMMPANVLIGRGSPLFMYLLSPASLSSPNLNLDRMVFWTQYPGSRHGEISMLQHTKMFKIQPSAWLAQKQRFGRQKSHPPQLCLESLTSAHFCRSCDNLCPE